MDIFETDDGLKINEINHTMEFKNSEIPTNTSISGAIIDYCVKVEKNHEKRINFRSIRLRGGKFFGFSSIIRELRLQQVTSRQFAGQPVSLVHPNLRKLTDLFLFTLINSNHAMCFFCRSSQRSIHGSDAKAY